MKATVKYNLSKAAHRAIVAGGIDVGCEQTLVVDIPREWITKYPRSVAVRSDGSWDLKDELYFYGPSFIYPSSKDICYRGRCITAEKILTPDEVLERIEKIFIGSDVHAELDKRLTARQELLAVLDYEGKLFHAYNGKWERV